MRMILSHRRMFPKQENPALALLALPNGSWLRMCPVATGEPFVHLKPRNSWTAENLSIKLQRRA